MSNIVQLIRIMPIMLCCLLLPGCWSAIELNERAFISIMILDITKDGEIEVTLGMPLTNTLVPGETGSAPTEGGSFAYFSKTADSIETALQKIQGDLSRRITFGQNRNIIVGRKYAEQGISPVLELAARYPTIRLNTNLFLVDGYAKDMVSKAPPLTERLIVTILNEYVNNNFILDTTVLDMLRSQESGGNGIIPILSFDTKNVGALSKMPPSIGNGGGGIFRKGVLVEPLLSIDQATSARVINNQRSQAFFSIASPTDGNSIGFYSKAESLKTKLVRKDDGIHIVLQPTSDVEIVSSNSDIDLMDQKNIALLKDILEQRSNEKLREVLSITQKTKTDVFHFDRRIDVNYPAVWKQAKEDWPTYYSEQLKFDIESTIHLKRKGSTLRSFKSIFMDGSNQS